MIRKLVSHEGTRCSCCGRWKAWLSRDLRRVNEMAICFCPETNIRTIHWQVEQRNRATSGNHEDTEDTSYWILLCSQGSIHCESHLFRKWSCIDLDGERLLSSMNEYVGGPTFPAKRIRVVATPPVLSCAVHHKHSEGGMAESSGRANTGLTPSQRPTVGRATDMS